MKLLKALFASSLLFFVVRIVSLQDGTSFWSADEFEYKTGLYVSHASGENFPTEALARDEWRDIVSLLRLTSSDWEWFQEDDTEAVPPKD